MSAPNVSWRHYNATGDADGVARCGGNVPEGRHVVAAGGWSGGNEFSTDEVGSSANPVAPMIGWRPDYDPGTDTTNLYAMFACPPGVIIRVHIWATLAPEA